MAAIAAGLIGGAALGVGGSILSGTSKNRAARKARDWYDKRTGAGFNRLNQLYYGIPPDPRDPNNPQGPYVPGYGEPSLRDQQRGLANRVGRVQQGIMGQFDQGTQRLGQQELGAQRGILDYYQQARGAAGAHYGNALSNADTYMLGAENLIDEQTQRDLGNATDLAQSRLASTGFRSTAGAQELGGIAESFSRGARQQKLGVRGQRAGMAQQALLGRAQTDAQLAGQGGGIYGQLLSGGLGRGYARQSERTGLQERNLGRTTAALEQPINTSLGVQMSSVNNPWLQHNSSQFYPGASGIGQGMMQAGQMGVGLGGYLLGQQAYGPNAQGNPQPNAQVPFAQGTGMFPRGYS